MHFATSCTAAAQPQFNRAVALLHSFEFGDAIDGFSATLAARSVLRDGRVGHRAQPVGQPVRRRHPPGRAVAAGARRRRARAGRSAPKTAARARVRRRGRRSSTPTPTTIDQRARVRAYRDAMATRRRGLPGRHRSVDLLRAVDRRRRITDRQDLRQPAEGRRDPREALRQHSRIIPASRTTSSTATTCRRWPTGRSPRRAATRPSRRRRRTRCTCRRTRSRASAPGRSRSTPTSPRQRRAKREGRPPKSCTRWTTRSTRTCRPAQDAERARAARRRCPQVGALRPATRSARRAPRLGRRVRAGGDPGALRARARRLGRSGARSTAAAEPLPLPRGDDVFRARRSARRAPATPRRHAPVSIARRPARIRDS